MKRETKPEAPSGGGALDPLTRREVLKATAAVGVALTAPPGLGARDGAAEPAAAITRESLVELFRKPPSEYAPIDNWWWEAAHLEKEKLSLQLSEMKARGIGGSWFYPRWVYGEERGLSSDPPYWSDEWWKLTRYSLEEHRRLGLRHYFSNWTATGFQQNLVRKERERDATLEGRAIAIHRLTASGMLELGSRETLLDAAAYRKTATGVDYASRRDLAAGFRNGRLEWQSPGADWIAAAIVSKPWDLDYLNERVGRRFADVFLGEYERRLPGFVGNTLEAFGADEMILLNGEIAYSESLVGRVRAERRYDIKPNLIALFHDAGDLTDRVRCDYYGALSALLEEGFYRPSMEWLERRGMKHATLSQLGAGDPLDQTLQLGDIFRYLRTFHVPGNEDPGTEKPGHRRLMASKLSSSVANLYGRSRVVMCVHYSAGWGQTQEENIAWSNESYAKGLNLYTRHGNLYTLMGGWYEYVPPADHFHQPGWRYWDTFVRYATRLSFLLSQGKHRPDVALFYPITTIHAHWVAGRTAATDGILEGEVDMAGEGSPFDRPAIEASQSLEALAGALYGDGIDFDFVDCDSLERATVRGGVLEMEGIEFRSIVLPAMSTIRLASMRRIRDFYEAGGAVLFYGRIPTASAENGRADPELRGLIEGIFGSVPKAGVASQRNARGGRASFVPKEAERVPSALSAIIDRDVAASEGDLFHLHRKMGEVDVYYLFNVRPEARELAVRFRAQGRVEIWDPFSGEARAAEQWRRVESRFTEVQLRMEPNEGVLVVFSPGKAEGRVVTQTASIARTIPLRGPFAFRLEPTMDNRWGDFRYPATRTHIGAEARRFRYAQENGPSGEGRGWHRADFDDAQWRDVIHSYGPYWWHLGAFASGAEPAALIEQARNGEIDIGRAWPGGTGQMAWQQHTFSKKFGYFPAPAEHSDDEFELAGVPQNFMFLGKAASDGDTHYWHTNVQAPAAGELTLQLGVKPTTLWASIPMPQSEVPLLSARAWINGVETLLEFVREGKDGSGQVSRVKVTLRKGWNSVMIEVRRPANGPLSLYASLHRGEPEEQRLVPLLRWFRDPQELVYDITPRDERRIAWYRFKAPPGLRRMRFQSSGRVLQAWVDGEPAVVGDGDISLRAARSRTSQVALRVEQLSGGYAGAAFPEPIAFDCATGEIPTGDWSLHGLASYSGIGIYAQDVRLQKADLDGKLILDLGLARNVAEVLVNGRSAGVRLARPFRLDITALVKEGVNRVEIKIANTLANHMSTYPTRWVLEGQTVSGLLGPVEIRCVKA